MCPLDTVRTGLVRHTLSANVESLVGLNIGGIMGKGILGNDSVDGGAGQDTMIGGWAMTAIAPITQATWW